MKLYQAFESNQKAIADMEEPRNLTEASKTLRARLIDMGYTFLENLTTIAGVPTVVVIGKEFGKGQNGHKQDFGQVAQELNLPYMSGEAYTQRDS